MSAMGVRLSRPQQLDAEARTLGLQFARVLGTPLRVIDVENNHPVLSLSSSELSAPSLPCLSTADSPSLLSSSSTEGDSLSSCVPFPKKATDLPESTALKCSVKGEGESAETLTIFFIHGLGGRGGQFRHQIHFLSQRGCRCIAVDLPGHGESRLGVFDNSTFTQGHTRKILSTIFDYYISGTSPCFQTLDRSTVTDEGESSRTKTGSTNPSYTERDDDNGVKSKVWNVQGKSKQKGGGPGHRTSEGSSSITLRSHRRRAVIIGHSLGALHAMTLYADLQKEGRGNEVAGIVLICPRASYPSSRFQRFLISYIPAFILEFFRGFIKRRAQRMLFHPLTLLRNLSLVWNEDSVTRLNPMSVIVAIIKDLQTGLPTESMQEDIRTYRDDPSRPPVLLLCGEQDAVCPVEENASILYDELTGHRREKLAPPLLANTGDDGRIVKLTGSARSVVSEEKTKGEEQMRNEKSLRGVLRQAFYTIYRGIVKENSQASGTLPNSQENRNEIEKVKDQVLKKNELSPSTEVALEIIPKTGHNCMLEDPYTTNRVLWTFVKRVRE
ncbi:alpha beta hydrolase family protein [Cystoisospora suis]|uniref:Alpha beta hydrolase family protein n=1 Tax=Cystoisospora suis TaxID=483139 RepID=A0A2C6KS65_9APIC|nr:alpha beta hydrolase family protein [Cystoisospora suis]